MAAPSLPRPSHSLLHPQLIPVRGREGQDRSRYLQQVEGKNQLLLRRGGLDGSTMVATGLKKEEKNEEKEEEKAVAVFWRDLIKAIDLIFT